MRKMVDNEINEVLAKTGDGGITQGAWELAENARDGLALMAGVAVIDGLIWREPDNVSSRWGEVTFEWLSDDRRLVLWVEEGGYWACTEGIGQATYEWQGLPNRTGLAEVWRRFVGEEGKRRITVVAHREEDYEYTERFELECYDEDDPRLTKQLTRYFIDNECGQRSPWSKNKPPKWELYLVRGDYVEEGEDGFEELTRKAQEIADAKIEGIKRGWAWQRAEAEERWNQEIREREIAQETALLEKLVRVHGEEETVRLFAERVRDAAQKEQIKCQD